MSSRRTPHPAARASAAVALLCFATAVVVVVAHSWREPLDLLVTVAAVTVGVIASWYVITRSGPARWLAAAVAVGSIATAGLTVLTSGYGILRAGVVVVAVVGAVAASGAALRNQPTRIGPAPIDAGPSTRPVLIMNPRSGGGKVVRFDLADEARVRGIEAVMLEPGDDLAELARDAIARGADVVGMAGGDGSQALVASIAAEHGVPFVCVPAGTRNHLALDLGVDRDDVVGALDAFGDGIERRVDLARVGDRTFVNNVSLGLYAKIVQADEYRDQKLATTADRLPALLGPDATPFDLRFTPPRGHRHRSAQLVLVSNNSYELTRLLGFGTRPSLSTGKLGIVAITIENAADLARFVALESVGRGRQFPGWLEWEAAELLVDSHQPIEAGVDGEALVFEPPLRCAILPGALRVRISRKHPGRSPAAASPSGSTLAALARILLGKA